MLRDLQQTFLLLNSLVILTKESEGCDSGWFGEDCRYMCHCALSTSCGDDGECPNNGRCSAGYFGPGCQYIDLASPEMGGENLNFLTDKEDSTCNPNSLDEFVEITLTKPQPFLWFRIRVNSNLYIHKFNVQLNMLSRCENERRFIDNKTVDVFCDTSILLQSLRVEGPIAPTVCTIRISGGRNVAIKQHAVQSSEITDNPAFIYLGKAHHAVDGNTNQSYAAGSCTHTGTDLNTSEWHLTYNRPQLLIRARIYNRDICSSRLRGFNLETFIETGDRTNSYTAPADEDSQIYDIPLPSRVPVTAVKVKVSNEILTLCEVQTYGETICPEGTYGFYCKEKCNCSDMQECNLVNGVCDPGCQPGFYGFNCSFRCNEYCIGGICSQRLGFCWQCGPGYTGSYCNEQCNPGTFGEGCLHNCSVHCSDVCNHRYGTCTCKGQYGGSLCTECSIGWYGDNCSVTCPSSCKSKECDIDSGQCEECPEGRSGMFCEECPVYYYGIRCEHKCSQNCQNGKCNSLNGSCPVCINSYSGFNCAIGPATPNKLWLLWLLLIPTILIAIISLSFAVRKRKVGATEEDEYVTRSSDV